MLSMGAKVQTENTKLNVPGAGSYESPSKVSRQAWVESAKINFNWLVDLWPFFLLQLVESQGKSMGVKYEIKELGGKLGPGPGGYSVDKAKKQNFAFS